MELNFAVALFQSRCPMYHAPSDARYRLYRSGRVMRSGVPAAMPDGASASDVRADARATSSRTGPPAAQAPAAALATFITRAARHSSLESFDASDHSVSFASIGSAILAGDVNDDVAGARITVPGAVSQTTALAMVLRNSNAVSRRSEEHTSELQS